MPDLPRTITIIRHAEKPIGSDPPFGVTEEGHHSPFSLTPLGWQRAGALALRFDSDEMPAPFVRPSALFAPKYPDGLPHRPQETITPLARKLGLNIDLSKQKEETEAFVKDVLLGQTGQDVLVCWEHHHIPPLVAALAPALGLSTENIPPCGLIWPDNDFSSVLVFAAQEGGGYTATQVSEKVLSGDS